MALEQPPEAYDAEEARQIINTRGYIGYAMLPCLGERVLHLCFDDNTQVPVQRFPLEVLDELTGQDPDLYREIERLVLPSMQAASLVSEMQYITTQLLPRVDERYHDLLAKYEKRMGPGDATELLARATKAEQENDILRARMAIMADRAQSAVPSLLDIRRLNAMQLPASHELAEHGDPTISVHLTAATKSFYHIDELLSNALKVLDELDFAK